MLKAENNENNNDQEITGVDEKENDNNANTLRRGKRRRTTNPRYFHEEMVHAIIPNNFVKTKKQTAGKIHKRK